MNILITSAGRRVSLVRAFMKERSELIPGARIYTADMKPMLSSACQVSDGSFELPHACSPAFGEALLGLCIEYDIKAVVPTIDTELKTLAGLRSAFGNHGIEIVVSDENVVNICRDKRLTHSFFDDLGLVPPRELDQAEHEFPLFVKPFNGSSSIGARVIRSRDELPYSAETDRSLMFLEYLDPAEYREYTIDMWFSRTGELKCAVPRERIEIRAGEVSKGVTRRGYIYEYVLEKFVKCPGFRGCITLQLFLHNDGKTVKAIEINPRFGGGYPLSYRSGANFPGMLIREYIMGHENDFSDAWESGLLMLRYDDEVLVHDYKG